MLTLESDLQRGIDSIDTILGQCMYFGLSFSRVGVDFRGLMVPIFTKTVHDTFAASISNVTRQFETDMDSFTLINKIASSSAADVKSNDPLLPPDTLLDFHPLAIYCNGLLASLNELRHCSPVSLAHDVTAVLQASLEGVARILLNFYRQEQQAFGHTERDNFVRFCTCFSGDLVPFVQRCLAELFPPAVLMAHLGVNAMTLQKEGICQLLSKPILEPLVRLLPAARPIEAEKGEQVMVQ